MMRFYWPGQTAAAATLLLCASATLAQQRSGNFEPRDLSGHWDRVTSIESFGDVPGGARGDVAGGQEAPFTAEGRTRFDANLPGYGPRRQMQRNDPLGRCEPA